MHVYGGVADDPQRPPTDRSAAAGSRARRPQINLNDRRTSPLEPQINPNRLENPATNQIPPRRRSRTPVRRDPPKQINDETNW